MMKTTGLLAVATMLAVLAVLYLGPRNSLGDFRVLEVKEMSHVAPESLINDLRGADIVFLGEQHNVMAHHEAQLDIIKALRRSGARMALGLEMSMAEQQPALDRWTAGEMSDEEFRKLFEGYWELPWDLYKEIFLYARGEGIPLVGLNIPRDITKKVSEKGFSALTQEDLGRLPIGLSCDVDENYMNFIKTVNKAHGRSGKGFVRFCEAQLLWDKVMAHHLVDYINNNPGTTVVVLSGTLHSWKKGIPEQVRRTSEFAYKVILPLTEDTPRETMNPEHLDYFLD